MFHHVARSVRARLLWYRDVDAQVLFDGIVRTFPELVALCVMPDHVHLLLPHGDPDNRLYRALAGYTRAAPSGTCTSTRAATISSPIRSRGHSLRIGMRWVSPRGPSSLLLKGLARSIATSRVIIR